MNKNIQIKDDERIDELHRNNYKLIQNVNKFCFGIDSVLLSDFAKIRKNSFGLDLGTGTGIIPILLEAKYNIKKVIGIDIQADFVDMAKRSVFINNLQDKITIELCDIKNVNTTFKGILFDFIISNPPYMNCESGFKNTNDALTIARHEVLCNLRDIISSSKLLKFGGKFYLVHRPNRLVDIFCIFREYGIEPKVIRFVQSFENKEPNIVLIEGVKGGKSSLNILPNLIVYNDKKEYTNEVFNIYYN